MILKSDRYFLADCAKLADNNILTQGSQSFLSLITLILRFAKAFHSAKF